MALVAFVAVLPMFGLTLYMASQDRQREVRQAEENVVRLAQLIGLAHTPALPSARLAACPQLFRHILEHFQRYENLALIERDGTLSCSALPTRGEINLAHRDDFRHALETGGFRLWQL